RKLPARKWFSISCSTRARSSASLPQVCSINLSRSGPALSSNAAAKMDSIWSVAYVIGRLFPRASRISMRKSELNRLNQIVVTVDCSIDSLPLDLAEQPRAGVNPLAFGCRERDSQGLGRVWQRQTGKVSEFNHASPERLYGLELAKGFVQSQ